MTFRFFVYDCCCCFCCLLLVGTATAVTIGLMFGSGYHTSMNYELSDIQCWIVNVHFSSSFRWFFFSLDSTRRDSLVSIDGFDNGLRVWFSSLTRLYCVLYFFFYLFFSILNLMLWAAVASFHIAKEWLSIEIRIAVSGKRWARRATGPWNAAMAFNQMSILISKTSPASAIIHGIL